MEETDLIYEGIETPYLNHLNSHFTEETDLIYEGIETNIVPTTVRAAIPEETDLIYEGIETCFRTPALDMAYS